jgi:phosphatidylserine/phosphatidylglycerophosphate/cardiolipin synthase-like enzyme
MPAKPPEPRPPAAADEGIAVYFSPHGGAMAALLRQIDEARESIDVQAYLLTSKRIAEALEAAQRRGVKVRVILDKRNLGASFGNAVFFAGGNIPVWRDGAHKDAHSKIILIDGRIIITGSFNFTDQSEDQNAENLLVIRDKPQLMAAYQASFEEHLRHSDPPK